MCGIMGYIGKRSCVDIVYNGLKRLEYRGYDSAGIAVLHEGSIGLIKSKGKLKELEPQLPMLPKESVVGIGHTRWATHGKPLTKNAHPHVVDQLGIVHNGIIENFSSLKAGLEAAGAKFETDTDTEVILHLLAEELRQAGEVKGAIISLIGKLRGAFSLGIIVPDEPDALYLVKQGSPLVVGLGEGENFFASDAAAVVEHTKNAVFLEDGELARLTATAVSLWNFDGDAVERAPQELEWSANSVEKQGYAHYMLKETHEQPTVIRQTISRLVDLETGEFHLGEFGLDQIDLSAVRRIDIIACGTAYYSGMVGRYAFEKLSQLPVNVELASEFRYRHPYLDPGSLVIAVSQSGETMDTLESIKYAKSKGCQTYSICNVPYSSITRECAATLYMDAGPEIGVASTKAFTSMVVCQYLLALVLGEQRRNEIDAAKKDTIKTLRALPSLIETALAQESKISEIATHYYESHNFIYIGRGEQYPIAMEGALKLKEISYIHAEGYAAGELKHGPIALIDPNMPVLAIAVRDFYYEKTISNIEQVKARNGRVIGLGEEGDAKLNELCDHVLTVPQVKVPGLQAVLNSIPLQLFSYYMALRRGTDVDQPRNLAKSVTVE